MQLAQSSDSDAMVEHVGLREHELLLEQAAGLYLSQLSCEASWVKYS